MHAPPHPQRRNASWRAQWIPASAWVALFGVGISVSCRARDLSVGSHAVEGQSTASGTTATTEDGPTPTDTSSATDNDSATESGDTGTGGNGSDTGTSTDDGTSGSGTGDPGTTGSEPPFAEIIGFTLVNADDDMQLFPVKDGDVIDPATMGSPQLTMIAIAEPADVGSVLFIVDNQTGIIENIEPYSVGGNIEGDFKPWGLSAGWHTIWALPYSQDHAKGEAGQAGSVTFELK